MRGSTSVAVIAAACLALPALVNMPGARAAADNRGTPHCFGHDQPTAHLEPAALHGPAHGTTTDGIVSKAWHIDHGKLKVKPPASGDTSLILRRAATCNLLAGFTPNNFDIASLVGRGSVLGLGRLTISPKVKTGFDYSGGRSTKRSPAGYDDRLAWILTIDFAPPSSCPNQSTVSRRLHPDYEVFAIDAATGGSAIEYTARHPQGCGSPGTVRPTVSVPSQAVSVPWTLIWTSRHRKQAEIAVDLCPRESVLANVNVERHSHQVMVAATRHYGPLCATPKRQVIGLLPATIHDRIPRHLRHAPVGAIDWPAPY